MTKDERLWTKRECAAFLNVGVRSLDRMPVPRVKLPAARGRREMVRFDPAQVKAWIDTRRTRKFTPEQKAS